MSSDRLIDELWGGQPPETAATALHGAVSQLRKSLEPGRATGAPGSLLVTRSPGYQLRVERTTIDAVRFEALLTEGRGALDAGEANRAAGALRDALDIWRGPALSGVDDAPSAHAEATRLEELRLEALEERIDADLALGRDEELVPELQRFVEREPLRERLRGHLMLALYRAGRQAEALAAYQDARSTFVARLGIEPSPRLRELEQAMLRQDPELDEGLPRVRPRRVLRRRRRAALVAVAVGILVLAAAAASAVLLTRPDAPLRGVPGSVAVVDPEAMRVVDTIEVGSGPVAIAYGHGSIWVANSEDGTVSRIDPESREVVKVIGVPSPVDLAVGTDAIWVAGGIDGTVSRIDPESNDVVAEIDLSAADPLVPRTVNGVAAGPSGVWAAVAGEEVVRIDPARDRVVRSIDVGAAPVAVASAADAVWAVAASGELLRIEPATGAITSRLAVGAPGSFAGDVGVADDGVPVVVGDVWIVNPDTTQLERTLGVAGFVTAVADAPGPGLWAAAWSSFPASESSDRPFEGTLLRFTDPVLGEQPRSLTLGSAPYGVAVGAGFVWVALGESEI